MARIRSVKPELRRDLTVAEWPRECRYAWVLLWGYLDDDGRGIDDLRLLAADLFPLDRDVSERKLDGWLDRMASPAVHGAPPLCRYEVAGRRFLHAPKWDRSQRVSHPQKSNYPPCPLHEASGTVPEAILNGSGMAPERFRPSRTPEVLGVKGSRGQGATSGSASAVDAQFETWWQVYPRREAKAAARKAYAKAVRDTDPDRILVGTGRYRDDPNRDPAFTPHPATWLNAGRWDDEPLPPRLGLRAVAGLAPGQRGTWDV